MKTFSVIYVVIQILHGIYKVQTGVKQQLNSIKMSTMMVITAKTETTQQKKDELCFEHRQLKSRAKEIEIGLPIPPITE